jgi:hypothetical protein
MLKAFAAELGGDATQDVSRLLRLPGFLNVKDVQNGAVPLPCNLMRYEPKLSYSVDVFERWQTPPAEPKAIRQVGPLSHATFGTYRERRRIEGLLRHLDRDVPDRSRRDFGVICALLEMLHPDEIWELVRDRSKFATAGEQYFQVTLRNALYHIGR